MATGLIPPHLLAVRNTRGLVIATAWSLTDSLVITAAHALRDMAGREAQVELEPLQGGPRLAGQLLALDEADDLALIRVTDVMIACRGLVAGVAATRVRITGASHLADPDHDYRFLSAVGEVQGPGLRDGRPLLVVKASGVLPGMSGAPVVLPQSGLIVGVLSGRYNSADGWARDTAWCTPVERVLALVEHRHPEGAADVRRLWVSNANALSGAAGGTSSPIPEPEVLQPYVVPRQLPATDTHFGGRHLEMARIETATAARGVKLVVITGPPGAGKSALAAVWGHRMANSFPDGQLYIDLQGFGDYPSIEPGVATAELLTSLGIRPRDVPPLVSQRGLMLRSLLADRAVFVLLDNAASYDQVLPMLPGGDRNVVFVTSRNALPELAVRHGAFEMRVAGLEDDYSRNLIRTLLGEDASLKNATIDRILDSCERLPLALRIVAYRLRSLPASQRQRGVELLVAESSRLDFLEIADGNGAVGMRSVIGWSLDAMEPELRTDLLRLAASPTREVSSGAAAALWGRDQTSAERSLEALTGGNLLIRTTSGYRAYDLVRVLGRELAAREIDTEELGTATHRLAQWYAEAAVAADKHIASYRTPVTVPPGPAVPSSSFADRSSAIAWFDAERANITRIVESAMSVRLDDLAVALATASWGFYTLRKYRDDWLATHELALVCALRTNTPAVIGRLRDNLGLVYLELGLLDEAENCLREAISVWRSISHKYGEAASLDSLSLVMLARGEAPRSMEVLSDALRLVVEIGDTWGQGRVLNHVGSVHLARGDNDQARGAFADAVATYRECRDDTAEAGSLYLLGLCELAAGRTELALLLINDAIALQERQEDLHGEATSRASLGEALLQSGDLEQAVAELSKSLELFTRLHDPEADKIARRIAELS